MGVAEEICVTVGLLGGGGCDRLVLYLVNTNTKGLVSSPFFRHEGMIQSTVRRARMLEASTVRCRVSGWWLCGYRSRRSKCGAILQHTAQSITRSDL